MTFCFALSVVITRHRRDISMAPAICLSQFLVLVVTAPFAHPLSVGSTDLLLIVALGVGQIGLGLAFLTIGARLIPAAEVALITLLEVVLGPLWVWLALSERPEHRDADRRHGRDRGGRRAGRGRGGGGWLSSSSSRRLISPRSRRSSTIPRSCASPVCRSRRRRTMRKRGSPGTRPAGATERARRSRSSMAASREFVGIGVAPQIHPEARTLELGYVVAPAWRGRGIATQALGLLTIWSFEEAGALRSELFISAANEGSKIVAARCGYVREGVLRSVYVKDGKREDTEIWSRLPSD